MISFTERTILDRRTLGRICDHGTTECKDMITLCENNRGYCSVYVCNKGLQEILRLSVQNDEMNCHCERSEAIQFLGRGMRILTGLPRKSDDFLAMTDNRSITKTMHNDQNGLVVMFSSAKHHKAQETKPETNRNQIPNELWQKQFNRNLSTCVAQREVA